MHTQNAPSAGLAALLFSPSGEIGRPAFVAGAALLASLSVAVDKVIPFGDAGLGLFGFAFATVIAWSAGCLSRKRLHDLGLSGVAIAVFIAGYITLVLAAPPLLGAEAEQAPGALVVLGGPLALWVVALSLAPRVAWDRLTA